jgi:hypothetical protein
MVCFLSIVVEINIPRRNKAHFSGSAFVAEIIRAWLGCAKRHADTTGTSAEACGVLNLSSN